MCNLAIACASMRRSVCINFMNNSTNVKNVFMKKRCRREELNLKKNTEGKFSRSGLNGKDGCYVNWSHIQNIYQINSTPFKF